jgi:hypothetical protein
MQSEEVPFEKGFATIVVERIIDVLMLGGVVLITTFLQANSEQFQEIMEREEQGDSNRVWIVLGIIFLGAIIGFITYSKHKGIRDWVNNKVRGFWEGIKSVWTMKRKWMFAAHTLFIWFTYVAMMWASAYAFPETRDLPIEAIMGAFVVGAAAIAILPGGIGIYPIWVTAVLAMYDVDFAAFGIFVWAAQTLLLLVLGLLSLAVLQWRKNA